MEGRGRSRRRDDHKIWKQRLSAIMAIVLTAIMVLNMPLSINRHGFQVSDAFASGSDAERDSKDSVWATASNAKYKKGTAQDVDIYVIAEDNAVVPGNMASMTLYLKNNTDEEITDGVLTFSSSHIAREDGYFTDISAEGETAVPDIIIGGSTAGEVPSGAGLTETKAEADTDLSDEAVLAEEEEKADALEAEGDSDEKEEQLYKLTDIDLLPGELYEVQFDFYTEEDEKSTKANVKFSFNGEGTESEKTVRGEEKFYYSIGLPVVNLELTDGIQIETGVPNEMNIWMTEPDWVDEKLEEKLEEQEKQAEEEEAKWASDSDAEKATPSDASPSNAKRTADEIQIEKYSEEAMTISESKVSYTVEIFGTEFEEFHPKKAEEADDIGWISCMYELAREVEPGFYYGKVTASGKWNRKSFVSEQGFLFEVTGEGELGHTYEAKLDNIQVTVFADEGILPRSAELCVTELKEEDAETADQFQEAKEALDAVGTQYDGMMALDIKFLDTEGNEIEPDGNVQVTIEMDQAALPEDADPTSFSVHHMKELEDGSIEVECVTDNSVQETKIVDESTEKNLISLLNAEEEDELVVEAATEENEILQINGDSVIVEFTVESFSSFTLTWKGSNGISIECIDTNKNSIGSNSLTTQNITAATAVNNIAPEISGYSFVKAIYVANSNYSIDTAIEVKRLRRGSVQWQYSSFESGSSDWKSVSSGQIKFVYSLGTALYDLDNKDITNTYETLVADVANSIEQEIEINGDDGTYNLPITDWQRSANPKKFVKNGTGAIYQNNSITWNWSDVEGIDLNLTEPYEVWDGSRLKEENGAYVLTHQFTNYLESNKVTAQNGILYDSATWKHIHGDDTFTMYRFQGSFTLAEGMTLDDYSFTIKPVTPGNNIYINDDIYVFVYPENAVLNDSNFTDYLAFWTGTIAGDALTNKNQDIKFHGISSTKAYWDTDKTGYKHLTDGWYLGAVEDNAGSIMAGTSGENFIIDVFADDYASGGGMYRLKVEAKPIKKTAVKFRKVDENNVALGLKNAKFQLVNNKTGMRYPNLESDQNGYVEAKFVPGTYTLTETGAPAGYEESEETWTIEVTDTGFVIKDSKGTELEKDNEGIYYITNKVQTTQLLVTKKWEPDNVAFTKPAVTMGVYWSGTDVNGNVVSNQAYTRNGQHVQLVLDGIADNAISGLQYESGAWNGIFTNLPLSLQDNGKMYSNIQYVVREIDSNETGVLTNGGITLNGQLFQVTYEDSEMSSDGKVPPKTAVTNCLAEKTLTISKIVDGNMGFLGHDAFKFSLTLMKGSESYTGGLAASMTPEKEMTLPYDTDNKKYKFELEHGQTITIKVPAGYDYKVVEDDYSAEGYSTYISVGGTTEQESLLVTGTLTEDVTIQYRNYKQVDTPTGITINRNPFMLILALAVICFGGFMGSSCIRKKRSRFE